jgi:hypothetical protein
MALSFTRGRRRVSFAGIATTLALLLLMTAAGLSAQTGDERLRELERQVAELKAQVEALRSGGATGETTGGDDRLGELERRIEVLATEIEQMKIGEAAAQADESEYGLGPAASKIYRTERGLSIGGYGEVLYQKFDDERDNGAASGRTDTFDALRAVLYFGYKWNDRWLLNTEIEFEHAGGSEAWVEFAYIDYLWRPEANLRGGLLLLPMGFVNELHEPTVFLGATRPDTERVIISTTWRENGFGLWGEAGPVSYRTYVVNGMRGAAFTAGGLRGGRQRGKEARAEDLAWVGRLDFTGIPGFLIGGSAYIGDSGQDQVISGGESVGVGTQIFEGHLEWRWRGLELRALAARAELDDVARLNAALGFTGNQSVGESLEGQYVQLGYDVLAGRGGERSFTPYVRWEEFNTQADVPAGFRANPANDVESLTLGFAFQPIDEVVIKVDHQDYDNAAGTGIDQFNVLLGYIF